MTDRVNSYYQLPISRDLLRHLREDIGLTGKYLDIFDDLRTCSGDTQLHADNVRLSRRNYSESAKVTHGCLIMELIRLAEIGLQAENKKNP